MIKIGDIFYVKKGTMSSEFDGVPVIIYMCDGHTCRARYQVPGIPVHSEWHFEKLTFSKYLERKVTR
jgi:hypothetical protein